MDTDIRLTKLAKRAGCAAKAPPGYLLPLLGMLPKIADPRVLVGSATADEVLLKVDDLPDDTPCVVMFDTLKVADFITNDDGNAEVHLKRESLERTYK